MVEYGVEGRKRSSGGGDDEGFVNTVFGVRYTVR